MDIFCGRWVSLISTVFYPGMLLALCIQRSQGMLRLRFHGRGGQGMKTASRIVGSAAFHAGFVVQDSPIYGAERRGAPMAAFTRLAREPIRERGAIVCPDLVVVADESLLADPSAQPLTGCDDATTLLLNSAADGQAASSRVVTCSRVLAVNFTALALEKTGAIASLSTALGVAAAKLVGLPFEAVLAGLEEEFSEHLGSQQREANRQLAQAVYTLAGHWAPVQERGTEPEEAAQALVEVTFDAPRVATPSVYAVGNSPERRTGNWRQFRPVLQQDRCTRCWICFVRCPEAAIALDANDYPVVDYDECKGCLLCVHECPTQAFTAEREIP
jgi:pyruvate ferredoxin oxidoreductase gamma subunit